MGETDRQQVVAVSIQFHSSGSNETVDGKGGRAGVLEYGLSFLEEIGRITCRLGESDYKLQNFTGLSWQSVYRFCFC